MGVRKGVGISPVQSEKINQVPAEALPAGCNRLLNPASCSAFRVTWELEYMAVTKSPGSSIGHTVAHIDHDQGRQNIGQMRFLVRCLLLFTTPSLSYVLVPTLQRGTAILTSASNVTDPFHERLSAWETHLEREPSKP